MMKFVPAVWYSKEDHSGSLGIDRAGDNSNTVESARILKADCMAVSGGEADLVAGSVNRPRTLHREYSVDDTDALLNPDSDYTDAVSTTAETEQQLFDGELFLQSCGILTSMQHQNSVTGSGVTQPKAEITDRSEQHTGLTELQRISLLAPLKSHSLDIHVDCDPQQPTGAGSNKTTTQAPDKTTPTPDKTTPAPDKTTPVPDKTLTQAPDVVAAISSNFSAAKDLQTDARAADVVRGDVTATNAVSAADDSSGNSDVNNEAKANADASAVKHDAEGARSDVTMESWDLTESGGTASSPKPVQLYHPCMKMSFSEGSLAAAFHPDLDEVSLEASDMQTDGDILASAFSKFRVKMSNFALPSIPTQQSRQQQAKIMAKENRLKSELRFKNCKTRIILL